MLNAKKHNTRSLYFTKSLTEAMDRIPDYPLTIVEAPMGYGKTTAVREYLNNKCAFVLWQSIYDNTITGFWSGFCRLFRDLDDAGSQKLIQLGFPNDSVSNQEALRIIEDIEFPDKTILVIDDYHMTDSLNVNFFIEFLLRNELTNLHIILTARYTDFKNIEELKLKGYVHHITKEAFELMPDEIVGYYKLCGIALSDTDSQKLYSLTEGWISALYLIMLDFIAEGRYSNTTNIYKLLEKTVFTSFSEGIKDFLLTMCIFDSFTLEQAICIWNNDNAEMLIAEISGKNAFVNYNANIKTFQIHNMFETFLKERFDIREKRFRDGVYQRAAEWFVKKREYLNALHYYHLCGNHDALLTILEQSRSKIINNEHKTVLIQYLEDCPREIRARHHLALLIYAVRLFTFNEKELFKKTCMEITTNILSDADLDEITRNQLLGEFELVLSFTKYNDINGMSEHHRKACKLMSKDTSVIDKDGIWTFGSPSVLYLFYRESGALEQHVRNMTDAMPYYYETTCGHGYGAEHVMQAEWHYYLGRLDDAGIALHKGLYDARTKKQTAITICANFLQMRIALFKGDLKYAHDLLQSMRAEMVKNREYIFIHTLDMCESFIYAALKQTAKIPVWIAEGDFNSSRLFFPTKAFSNIIYGRVLLTKGEYLKLLGIAGQFMGIASIFPNLLASIYTKIYIAAANNMIYRCDEAVEALKQALDMAMPDKFYMPFVENCDYIKPLLEELYNQRAYCEDIARILELYKTYQKSVESITKEYFMVNKPVLSAREAEIARLAADGLSNREIGERLFISQNTVKTQLKSVFEKMDINSRALLKQYFDENT